jgi:hypothetical protein
MPQIFKIKNKNIIKHKKKIKLNKDNMKERSLSEELKKKN